MPKVETLTHEDAEALRESRGWEMGAGIELARRDGRLHTTLKRDGAIKPLRCWCVTENARKVFQLRKLDGEPFQWRWQVSQSEWVPANPSKAKTSAIRSATFIGVDD